MSCLPALAMAAARMTLQLLHITSASGWLSLKASAGSSQLSPGGPLPLADMGSVCASWQRHSAPAGPCSIACQQPMQQAIAQGSRRKLSRHHNLLCHFSRLQCTATDAIGAVSGSSPAAGCSYSTAHLQMAAPACWKPSDRPPHPAKMSMVRRAMPSSTACALQSVTGPRLQA